MSIALSAAIKRSLLLAAVSSCALLWGCSSTPSTITLLLPPTAAPLATGGASTVYVTQGQSTARSVLGFSTSGSGAAPTVLTTGSPTYSAFAALAVDSTGQVYTAGTLPDGTEYIKVFAAGATGQANAARGFAPSSATLPVTTLATDASSNLCVAGGGGLNVYTPVAGATNPAPAATITLPAGQTPVAVAIDGVQNIYVASNSAGSTPSGSIFVYAQSSAGAAPMLTRTITSSALFAGLTASSSGFLYATENTSATNVAGGSNSASIVEFASGASGAAAPAKTISGTATGLSYGGAIEFDSVGNVYAVNIASSGTTQNPVTTPTVLAFGPAATGNEPAALTLSSSVWTIPGTALAMH